MISVTASPGDLLDLLAAYEPPLVEKSIDPAST